MKERPSDARQPRPCPTKASRIRVVQTLSRPFSAHAWHVPPILTKIFKDLINQFTIKAKRATKRRGTAVKIALDVLIRQSYHFAALALLLRVLLGIRSAPPYRQNVRSSLEVMEG
jgi:hypothetical protein